MFQVPTLDSLQPNLDEFMEHFESFTGKEFDCKIQIRELTHQLTLVQFGLRIMHAAFVFLWVLQSHTCCAMVNVKIYFMVQCGLRIMHAAFVFLWVLQSHTCCAILKFI